MSVTFRHNGNPGIAPPASLFDARCLCGQMGARWNERDVTAEELRSYAEPACRLCGGSGVDPNPYVEPEDSLNVSNRNAYALLRVLGVDYLDRHLSGRVDLATLEAALLTVRGDMSRVAREVRAPAAYRGARGCRVFAAGLPEDQVVDYLDRLEALVSTARLRRATAVVWA